MREIEDDLARPHPMQRLLQGDVGSGQDRGRRDRRAAGDRCRLSVGADGAHDDPRRAALREARRVDRGAGGAGRLADRQPDEEAEGVGARRHRRRDRQARDRHARADPGRRALREPRARHRRRAAPLRRRPAPRAPLQGPRGCGPRARTASTDDERDADPADARDDLLRGPRRVDDRPTAAGPPSDFHEAGRRRASRRGDRAGPRGGPGRTAGVLGLSAGRGGRRDGGDGDDGDDGGHDDGSVIVERPCELRPRGSSSRRPSRPSRRWVAALPDVAVGLVHGRLSNADKAEAMRRFHAGETGVLVATRPSSKSASTCRTRH